MHDANGQKKNQSSDLVDIEKTPPKVSIGLAVFNGENYLREALDSILAQTFTDFELIISDNCSTDSTVEICKAYAESDPRISLHLSDRNRGAAWNFNRAFEYSRGKYFRWAAHDDKVAPTLLERCVEVLDNNPEVALCYPKTVVIDEVGNVKEYDSDHMDLRSVNEYERFSDFIFCTHRDNYLIFGLMRRDVLAKTPLFQPYDSSDRVLVAEMALRGQISEIDDYLFFRRDHPMTSRRANTGLRQMTAWFDPNKKTIILSTTVRVFLEYMKFPLRVPMHFQNMLKYYCVIAKYTFHKYLKGLLIIGKP
jgi:glycosyltransferase involved in cell wall biosynthesis